MKICLCSFKKWLKKLLLYLCRGILPNHKKSYIYLKKKNILDYLKKMKSHLFLLFGLTCLFILPIWAQNITQITLIGVTVSFVNNGTHTQFNVTSSPFGFRVSAVNSWLGVGLNFVPKMVNLLFFNFKLSHC